jgi:hypothetical protein
MKQYCQEIIAQRDIASPHGVTIFSGKKHTIKHPIGMYADEMRKNIAIQPDMYIPRIIGCVYYKTGDGHTKYTGVIFDIVTRYNVDGKERGFLRIGYHDVDKNHSKLFKFIGGDIAT